MIKKRALPVFILGATLLAGTFYYGYSQKEEYSIFSENPKVEAVQTGYNVATVPPTDFEKAAASAVPSVVHIKTVTKAKAVAGGGGQNPFGDMFGEDEMLRRFFGDGGGRPYAQPEQRASG